MDAVLGPKPEEALGERLLELTPRGKEASLEILERAESIAAEYPDHLLTGEDLEAARLILPAWRFNTTRIHGRDWGIARQTGHAMLRQRAILGDHYKQGERMISVESGNILLLAKTALRGSDLAVVLEIEQAGLREPEENKPPMKRRRRRAKSTGFKRPEQVQLSEQSELVLDEDHKNVLWLTSFTHDKIAAKLGIGVRTVGHYFNEACEINGMNQATLLATAFDEGRIDLSHLPEPNGYDLTERELILLKDYMFSDLQDAADDLELSKSYVGQIWSHIYNKMGLPKPGSRVNAFLVAKRDGHLDN